MSVSPLEAARKEPPQISLQLDDTKSFVSNLADCLNFSDAFSVAGFETVNDTLLREMNERAKMQMRREHEPRDKPKDIPKDEPEDGHDRRSEEKRFGGSEISPPRSPTTKDRLQASLRDLARINRSPPESRFSAAHNREFAQSDPITASSDSASSTSKRMGSGEESPSKRRRAPSGSVIGIPSSPTRPLQHLSLGKEHLEKVSVARQKDKHRKDQQLSPRRRMRNTQSRPTNNHATSSSPSALKPNPSSEGSSRPLPTPSFNIPGAFPGMPSSLPTPSLSTSQLPPLAPPRPSQKSIPSSTSSSSLSLSSPTLSPSTSHGRGLPGSLSGHSRPVTASKPSLRSSPKLPAFAPSTPATASSTRVAPPSIPRSQTVRSMPRSSSQRSVSSNATSTARAPKSLLPAFPDNLPSYARPTQATLRRSQSIQSGVSTASASSKDPRIRSVSGGTPQANQHARHKQS